ncbi:MAG: hypothetical protein WC002_06360 [Candidatus Muiribacteriota bacterium]
MKKFFLLFLILTVISSWACPSYELAAKTPEEMKVEFDTLIAKINDDFALLLKTYGSHSLPEFKSLVANWMTLYTRYECWVDITENKTAKTPSDKTRDWLDKIKNISVTLGKAISLFTSRDYSSSRDIILSSQVEFKTLITGTFFNQDNEMFLNFSDFIQNKNYVEFRNYYKNNIKNIEYMINYLKNNSSKYGLTEYYNQTANFYKKLADSVDNREKFEYTIEEIKRAHDTHSILRHANLDNIKKMWAEVK